MAFSAHDVVPDSPTNVFCTLNPLWKGPQTVLSEGNTKTSWSAAGNYHQHVKGTINQSSGKWYAEVIKLSTRSDSEAVGIASGATRPDLNGRQLAYNQETNGAYVYSVDAVKYKNGASGGSYGSSATQYDIIGIALDLDNGTISFYKNGTSMGTAYSDILSNAYNDYGWTFAVSGYGGTPQTSWVVNFGQDPTFGGIKSPTTTYTDANGIGSFYYQPPSGALALCTANLPDPTIDPAQDDVPEDYMKAVAYTGASADKRIDLNFQPDLVWIKHRSASFHHRWHDSVRGWEQYLGSSTSGAELDLTSYGDVFKNIDSTGFTLPNGTNAQSYNDSAGTYVTWCWKAGGAPDLTSSPTKPFAKDNVQYETLSAAGITAGTITPTAMSVNTKAGFSIVSYTGNGTAGATVGHGLNQAPEFMINKSRRNAHDWYVFGYPNNSAFSVDGSYLGLNNTSAIVNSRLHEVSLDSSVITFVDVGHPNLLDDDIIAYCWHSVPGYSAFGSYTGNGSTDGPFVYTGFRPAWVMIKSSSAVSSWTIYDTVRDTDNPEEKVLYANAVDIESTAGLDLDIVSNGFKFREGGGQGNDNGPTYIYAAFAEQPFKYANAR